tara:strand:- start:337 stop:447 length:111 start_codon:yes stop_codon:yes gene_type:complete
VYRFIGTFIKEVMYKNKDWKKEKVGNIVNLGINSSP